MRVAITGAPRTGKTVLSLSLTASPRSTDEFADRAWSEQSSAAAELFDADGDLVVEGVAVPRALRKWLASHPDGKPVDEVRYLEGPYEHLTDGQRSMGKGVRTVMREIAPELKRRGVDVYGI